MSNPSQLFLLADHIKLSLLERQRAISLNLEPNSQDGQISQSLESFREGLEAIETECSRLEESGDPSSNNLRDESARLRTQYDDLTSQFRGFPSSSSPANANAPNTSSLAHPNNPSLTTDFSNASTTSPTGNSSRKRSPLPSKSVRFTDNPPDDEDAEDAANRAALFPYRDEPSPGPPDPSNLTNQQIHAYHSTVLRDQDDQLDRLGESIHRQRDLSIQIGDELDSHVQLLDSVDDSVDRNQQRIDTAKRRLNHVARRARDHLQLTIILILIIILVLLIIILK